MAGRPRLPQEVAEISGAVVKNAGRFKGRATPKVKSLGNAPKRFTEDQSAMWREFNADFPWLGRSDRRVVGQAVLLQTEIDTADHVSVGAFGQMRLLLSSMGGTPVDKSKVSTLNEEIADPIVKYFR